jgi:hypothetical protein
MIATPVLKGYQGLTSKPGQRLVNQTTRIRLEFYPQDKNQFFSSRPINKRTVYWGPDSEAMLIAFVWNNQIGQASGKWSATIKLNQNSTLDLENGDVCDGDWVRCTVQRNGVDFKIFLGVVDIVRQSKYSSGGATVKTWTISGRDHGAPFEVPIAWASLYVQTVGQLIEGLYTRSVKGEVGGSPDKMFKLLIDAAFNRGAAGTKNKSSWALPPALEAELGKEIFRDALNVITNHTEGAYFNEIQLWTQAGQSLWDTLGTWCNPLLNEFWLDFANVNPSQNQIEAVIRERPFINTVDGHNSPWFSLNSFKVPSWIIEDDDLGRGGLERFNLFEVTADFAFGNMQEQTALASPLIDEEGIVKHGIRAYQQSTKFISPGNVGQGAWPDEVNIWMRKLVDWYGPNPHWKNGQIRTGVVFPEIKIGNIFTLDTGNEQTNEHYYIEGTGINWRYSANGSRSQSSFVLTRGYRGNKRDGLKLVKSVSDRFKEAFSPPFSNV